MNFELRGVPEDALMRALLTVAACNGEIAERERDLLDVAASALGAGPVDLLALAPITPAELAEAIAVPASREPVLAMLTAMALADGEASPEEAELLDSVRFALEVDAGALSVFRDLAEGQLRRARYELLRRSRDGALQSRYAAEGWRGLYQSLSGRPPDQTATETPLVSLAALPADTLGGALHALHTAAAFDAAHMPEEELRHDFLHVLTGYGVDPTGEVELGAFESGLAHEDPFGPLFMALVQYHAGVDLHRRTSGGSSGRGGFDPGRVDVAYRRGERASRALREWDPWSLREHPLDRVRARFSL